MSTVERKTGIVLFNKHYQAFFQKRKGRFVTLTPGVDLAMRFTSKAAAAAVANAIRFATPAANHWMTAPYMLGAAIQRLDQEPIEFLIRMPEHVGNLNSETPLGPMGEVRKKPRNGTKKEAEWLEQRAREAGEARAAQLLRIERAERGAATRRDSARKKRSKKS